MMTHDHAARGRPTRSRSRTIVASLAALALLAAACSAAAPADDTDATGTDTSSPGEGAAATGDAPGSGDPVLDFYQCLRDNGLDVADPDSDGGQAGFGPPEGIDPNDPLQREVLEDCRDRHFDGGPVAGGGGMGSNLADTDALIEFVDCMRAQGIDMPDPSPDGRLTAPADRDRNDPEFQAAVRDCASHLDGGGVLMGDGSGGGGTVGRRP